jgi:CRP-like cAMP-binding protein
MPKAPEPSKNRLLVGLPRADYALLAGHLEAVDLPVRRQLEARNRRIDQIYFVDCGIASVVANGADKRAIEVGIIGREGVTGLAVMMGDDRSPNETFMQVGGYGSRMSAGVFRDCMDESPSLRKALLRYAHAFLIQAANTALANGRHKVEERLARWLLMAHDRIDDDELPLTHEFLATMLGVRRPGVTVTLKVLERQRLIQSRRGAIEIIDRKGLEKAANGAYGATETEFRRLFG